MARVRDTDGNIRQLPTPLLGSFNGLIVDPDGVGTGDIPAQVTLVRNGGAVEIDGPFSAMMFLTASPSLIVFPDGSLSVGADSPGKILELAENRLYQIVTNPQGAIDLTVHYETEENLFIAIVTPEGVVVIGESPLRFGLQLDPILWIDQGLAAASIRNHVYDVGEFVFEGGYVWVCSQGGQSGSSEPEWGPSSVISDGENFPQLFWTRVPLWEPGHIYDPADLVQPTDPNGHHYAIILGTISGDTEPPWKTNGGTIFDPPNPVEWEDQGIAPAWEAEMNGLDPSVNIIKTLVRGNGIVWTPSIGGTAGLVEPDWPSTPEGEVEDGEITWVPLIMWTPYYTTSASAPPFDSAGAIQPTTPNEHFYQPVSENQHQTGTIEPIWPTDGSTIFDPVL